VDRRLFLFVIVLLTAALLASAAVPAIGRDTVAPSFDRRGSAAALAKAKRALRLARAAQRSARATTLGVREAADDATAARAAALAAGSNAAGARASAAAVQAQIEATRTVSASEPALVTSTAPIGEYEAKGGPAVEATVPSSGLIEVWAEVEIKDDEGGAVGLFEDGQKVPGVSAPELCGDDSALIDMQGIGGPGEFVALSTPPAPSLLGCASAGAPAPVLLSRPPGRHTYELRYSECSCGGEAEFRNRALRVGPRP
jgi:hypothetical protein